VGGFYGAIATILQNENFYIMMTVVTSAKQQNGCDIDSKHLHDPLQHNSKYLRDALHQRLLYCLYNTTTTQHLLSCSALSVPKRGAAAAAAAAAAACAGDAGQLCAVQLLLLLLAALAVVSAALHASCAQSVLTSAAKHSAVVVNTPQMMPIQSPRSLMWTGNASV
jgi:hypothetical protein